MTVQENPLPSKETEEIITALRVSEQELMKRGGHKYLENSAKQLADIGSAAVESLMAALKEDNRFVRMASCMALKEICDPRAMDSLISTLHDKDKQVRMFAAEALGRFGDARAIDGLLVVLQYDEHSHARAAAADALGSIGDPRAREPLQTALQDRDAWVGWAAEAAIKKMEETKTA